MSWNSNSVKQKIRIFVEDFAVKKIYSTKLMVPATPTNVSLHNIFLPQRTDFEIIAPSPG